MRNVGTHHRTNMQNHMHWHSLKILHFELEYFGVFVKFARHHSKKPVHSRICETFHISMVGRSVGHSFVACITFWTMPLSWLTMRAMNEHNSEQQQMECDQYPGAFMFFSRCMQASVLKHSPNKTCSKILLNKCACKISYSIDH